MIYLSTSAFLFQAAFPASAYENTSAVNMSGKQSDIMADSIFSYFFYSVMEGLAQRHLLSSVTK